MAKMSRLDVGEDLQPHISMRYDPSARVTLFHGDCLELLKDLPSGTVQLVVTSPPYNLGKPYERKRLSLEEYVEQQARVIAECVRVLGPKGSICWEVGNYVEGNRIIPLDIALFSIFEKHGLVLRNRIVWHFEHGLHCSQRFSGRYETILWFTKSEDYLFDLDAVRVPQKYPGKKYYKGPKKGEYSSHPLGKNPGDVWLLPNVKHNHPEKTIHPCQFPVELVERLILAFTNESDLVLDPFIGVGTTAVAAILHNRRAAGADVVGDYLRIAEERIRLASMGALKTRPMERPIYQPPTGNRGTKSRGNPGGLRRIDEDVLLAQQKD